MNAQEYLLNWCQESVRGYDSVRVHNFGSSWKDGRALLAILNRHRPHEVSFLDSFHRSNTENLRHAFDCAERVLGIAKILDPADVDRDYPDEKSIMTYVSMLCNELPNIPPHPDEVREETRRRTLLDEFSALSRSLMRWLRDSIATLDNRNVPNSMVEIKVHILTLDSLRTSNLPRVLVVRINQVKNHKDLVFLHIESDGELKANCKRKKTKMFM
jgi:spectrin beta